MKHRELKNVAASVHARLLNQARAGQRTFNELAQLHAMERFLYRLAQSRRGDRFILKGALLMRAWDAASFRTTRDIDLLGRVPNRPDAVVAIIREICEQPVVPDGLVFDAQTVEGESIVEAAEYVGIRVVLRAALGNMRLPIQIDVGFGDRITPEPCKVEFPTLLDLPSPRLLAYPPETVVAEKLHAMLLRGETNSRMKDFYDIRWIAHHFAFDGTVLGRAIIATCQARGTAIPAEPTALAPTFAASDVKAAQWRAFSRRIEPMTSPASFAEVATDVADFLAPIVETLHLGATFDQTWNPPGPWR